MDARELEAVLARPESSSLTNRSAALLRLDETWTGTDNGTYGWTPELAPMAWVWPLLILSGMMSTQSLTK